MAAKSQLSGMLPHQEPWFRWVHSGSCGIATGIWWPLTPRSVGSVSLGVYSSSCSSNPFASTDWTIQSKTKLLRKKCIQWINSILLPALHAQLESCFRYWQVLSISFVTKCSSYSLCKGGEERLIHKSPCETTSFSNTYTLHVKHLFPTLGTCEIPVRTLGSLNAHASDVKWSQHQYLHNWVNSDFVHILLCRLLHQVRGNKAEPSE